ncbi:MAG: glycosyltransferase family 39 protein [Bacteroidales bacterium]|nr:glycosyltransferase family 39 protein [Bacteroidales bacterium]MDY0216096.1 glycosyltransferase family 39 protein [Bacteroidales bacterium]
MKTKNKVPKFIPEIKKEKPSIWKISFITIAVIMGLLLPILSLDSGNSGDEDTWQYPQGERIYSFYTSFGQDTTYKSVPEMNPYGMWFDTLTVAVVKVFKIDNYATMRHILNALMGFLAILFAGLFAKNCKNWRAGVITMVLLFLSPRFLGHSFNNPKDIPFAAMFMISLYFIHKFILEYPKPSLKTSIKLAVAMGLAVSTRVGGVLLYAYFGLFLAAFYMFKNQYKDYFSKSNKPIINRLIFRYILVVFGAFIVTIPLWPYIMSAPIKNTIEAFKVMSHYVVSLRQNFEGILYWSDSLPATYTPQFILMTIPIAVIIGSIAYLFAGGLKKKNRFNTFMLYFAFIFPVFWIMYSKANVYGGWRHAMFIYPPLVITAGLGFDALIDLVKNKYGKIALTSLPFLMLITPLTHIVRNHPYEYVYFNEFTGGMKGAYGVYELDYYFHSLREASEWIQENATKDPNSTGDKIKVGAWLIPPISYFFRNDTARFDITFTRYYERGNSDWDYAIFVNTGIRPEQLQNGIWPPKNTVHTIDVDGKPICAILKRENRDDYFGNLAKYNADNIKENSPEKMAFIEEAIHRFEKAIEYDPVNETALLSLTEIYMSMQKLDTAMLYIDKLLSVNPSYESGLNYKGWISMQMFDVSQNPALLEDAAKAFGRIIQVNYKFIYGYYGLAMVYVRKNDVNNALQVLEDGMKIDPQFPPIVQLYNQLRTYNSGKP